MINNISYKIFLYAIIWFLHVTFLFKYLVVVIDPCSTTPHYDFSLGVYILIGYFIIFTLLSYSLANNSLKNKIGKIIFTITNVILLPFISFLISTYISYLFTIKDKFFYKIGLWEYIFDKPFLAIDYPEIKLYILSIIATLVFLYCFTHY